MNKKSETNFKDSFVFIPLGGATGIGMNCFAYGYHGKWLLIDCGIGFPDENLPGIDALLPSVSFFSDKKKDLLGLIVTHAHEDHIGGIPYLWSELKCPIFLTPFAHEILRYKLNEAQLLGKVPLQVVSPKESLSLSPFEIEFIQMNHSIPEATALLIQTPSGSIFHTGDWKVEKKPLIGEETDWNYLKKIGKKGILAAVCDSTNVLGSPSSKTEEDVRKSLISLIKKYPQQQVFVTCFASNVVRLESIYLAAQKSGKSVCLLGRSLWRIDSVARSSGYFKDIPEFLTQDEALTRPKGSVLYIATGCQGEPLSALNQLLGNTNPNRVSLEKDDIVIFSSRVIPGNEKPIAYLHKRLKSNGAKIITQEEELVHVSGHFSGNELLQLYTCLKPKIALPVHGQTLELLAHIDLVKQAGIKYAFPLEDGEVLSLALPPQVLTQVETAVLALDGKQLLPLNAKIIKQRRLLLEGRPIVLTIVLNKKKQLATPPLISSFGLIEENSSEFEQLIEEITTCLKNLTSAQKKESDSIRSILVGTIRKFLTQIYGKKALVEVHLITL